MAPTKKRANWPGIGGLQGLIAFSDSFEGDHDLLGFEVELDRLEVVEWRSFLRCERFLGWREGFIK